MSNELFLKHIGIPSFRNYICDFKLDIPDEPGLTVLVGANGLGKSSILHAVEWGLTGKVERLEKTEATAKQKLTAVGDSSVVKLIFSDGFTIDRNLNSIDSNFSALDDAIRKRLIHESWSNLSDLVASLQFTHFRGQCALQHFSNQDGKERYRRLEGVSRIGQLISIQQKLERRKTSDAFKNVKNSIEEKINALKETHNRFTELLNQKETLASLANAEMAMEPEKVHGELSKISKQLREIASSISFQLKECSEPDKIPLFLEINQADLYAIEIELSSRKENLLKWHNYSEEYMILLRLLVLLTEDEHAIVENQSNISNELEEARVRLSHSELLSAKVHENLNSAVLRLSRLQQLKHDFNELSINQKLCAKAENQYDDAQASFISHEKEFRKAENDLNTARNLADKHHKSLAEMKLWQQAKLKQERLEQEVRSLQQIRISNQNFKKEEEQLAKDEEVSIQLIKRLAETRIELEAQLREARRNTEVIFAAVVSIANTLKDSDLNCPVCRTPHAPGKLKELAQTATATSDSLVVVLEKQLKDLDRQSTEARRQLEVFKSKRASNECSYAQENELQKKVDSLVDELRKNDFLKSFEVANFEAVLVKGLAEISLRIESTKQALPRADELLQLQKVHDDTKSKLANEESLVQQFADKLTVVRNAIGILKGRIDTAKDDLNLKTGDLEQLELLIDTQAKCRAHEEQMHLEQKKKEAEVQYIVDKKAESLKQVSSKLQELMRIRADKNEKKENIKVRWRNSGYLGEPTDENVRSQIQRLEDTVTTIGAVRKKHDDLLSSFKLWNQQTELHEAEKRLNALFSIYNAKTKDDFLSSLEIEERETEVQYSNLKKAEQIRDSLKVDINTRLSKVKTDTFQPLNDVLDKFCSAMLTGWEHQIITDAVINKSSAAADLLIQVEGGKELLPQLILSEGQMAAVELCLMFSASETYPWSPWKALLLDDPLQHNDTIHAASFIDVLRNMIKERGYQVVITTHDVDEAGYYLRKCRNVGIPTQYCHLLSRVDGKMMYTTNN